MRTGTERRRKWETEQRRVSPLCHRSVMRGEAMGLVKTRRLAAMQKQQRAKAGMKPPKAGGTRKGTGFPPPFPNRPRKDSFPPNL